MEQCTYKVTKWKEVRQAKATGGLNDEPVWPKVQLGKTGKCLGCERQGDREERYEVTFKDDESGDEHRCGFTSAAKWKSFENGSKWVGQTGMIGGDLKCDKLEKAK